MIQHLLDSDIARAPLAGLNRQHVRHHCNEVEKKHGRSRGDLAAMVVSILWEFADQRLSRQCKLGERTNPVHRRARTYRAAPRLAWPNAVQRRFVEGNPLAPTQQGRAPAPPHLALAFSLLIESGQRRGDVCAMKWSDIEHDPEGHQWLMVHAQQKTGEAVPIPLHNNLRVGLAKHGGRHKSEFIKPRLTIPILLGCTGWSVNNAKLSIQVRSSLEAAPKALFRTIRAAGCWSCWSALHGQTLKISTK